MAFDVLSFVIGQQSVKGNGDSEEVKIVAKKGTFISDGKTHTLEHNLGVVPLFIWIYPSTGLVTSNLTGNELGFGVGVNQKVADALGKTTDVQYGYEWNGALSKFTQASPDYPIDSSSTDTIFHNANENTIEIGEVYDRELIAGYYYDWLAVGIAK